MALTYNQITSITENVFIRKLADNIFTSKAYLAYMKQPGRMKLLDGGDQIIVPIIYSKPGTSGRFYTNLDALNTDPTDNQTAARFTWKQQYEPIRISRLDLLKNNGDAAKLSLIASKSQIAQENIDDVALLGIFSDGTAATGALSADQHTGLAAAIHATSTYGNISTSDFAGWAATIKSNSGTNRALTLNLINSIIGALTEGKNRPDLAVMKQNVADELWGLFQPHQRLMNEGMKKLGFEGVLEVNGVPHIVDSHAPANEIQYLNSEFCYMVAHRDENWRKETLEKLETSNSMLTRFFWMGNIVTSNRRFIGKLDDIEVAA